MKKLLILFLFALAMSLGTSLNAQSDCDQSCIEWWLVIYDDYGRTVSEHYLYTTCDGEQSIANCDQSTAGRVNQFIHEDNADCEEDWMLSVVMSHEYNDFCGAYVKAHGRLTSRGGGAWKAEAYLDRYIGAQLVAGICETAFYSLTDRSFASNPNNPYVTANFIADIGIGINITISDGRFVEGDGILWFPTNSLTTFRSAEFRNPLCWN